MSLQEYQKKRNFKKSPEPTAKKSTNKKLIFIVQKHDASHLHYDLRLAWQGVLKSWAVPKGPSYDPQVKRLAVQVEDHPLSYANFEGIIPEGEYGGGTVMLWDKGTWEPLEDPQAGLKKGKLIFYLKGKKLKGEWSLIRTALKGSKPNWLLIKKKDNFANTVKDNALLNTVSVKSKKTLKEISNDQRVKKSKKA